MFMTGRGGRLAVLVALTLITGTWTGCSLEDPAAPALTAPSEFSTSVTLSATPDRLPRDGASQSVITLTVRDAQNRPVSGQLLSLAVAPAGARLSAAQVTTGATGQATFTVTAPPASAITSDSVVTVVATPVGSGGGAVPRAVTVSLIGAPNTSAPIPAFTVTPTTPEVLQMTTFDASATTDEGVVCNSACSYVWDFGGEASGFGRVVTYQFREVRTYPVTLTVADALGTVATLTQSVLVTQGELPKADFIFSPSSPGQFETVNFTAAGSTAGPGRTIASYEWNFGDGSSATGLTVSHAYSVLGTYSVTLTVKDNAGLQHSVPKAVAVVNGVTASFTFSPIDPRIGQTVVFNAEESRGSGSGFGGRNTITKYIWHFGKSDDTVETSSPITSTSFSVVNEYDVTLTVEDSAGRRQTTHKTVKVIALPAPPPSPTAPTSLIASKVSSSQINLTWLDNSSTESGFEIQRCNGAGCTNFVLVASVVTDLVSYNNTGLAPSTVYRYRVRAVNGAGSSGFSNIATATTDP